MNQQIEEYLSLLDLPLGLVKRTREITEEFKFLCGGEVERIFLSDTLTPHTVGLEDRHWVSLWGFSGPYWMEARDFLDRSDIDISPYWDSIKYLGVVSDGLLMPGPADADSRMSIEVETRQVQYSTISATGDNCNELISIVSELLLPNLMMCACAYCGHNPAQHNDDGCQAEDLVKVTSRGKATKLSRCGCDKYEPPAQTPEEK